MIWIDYILLAAMFSVGILSSISDILCGQIYNKILLPFFLISIPFDVIYYGFLKHQLLVAFLFNILIIVLILLILYYTKCFAGGDVKLGVTMSLLYPGSAYLLYSRSLVSLSLALCIAIFLGYIYLLFQSLSLIIKGKRHFDCGYTKRFLGNYVKSYCALVYIAGVNLSIAVIGLELISIPSWLSWALCFVVAWYSRRVTWMKKRFVIIGILLLDIVLALLVRTIPFSINPITYLLVAVLILCQMTISTGMYEEIPTEQVAPGMILSTYSTMLMQSSRVRNLPNVSHEDLRDRLTEEQANSVRRWGKTAKGSSTVTILAKIPFAIFIVSGFAIYFLIWGVLK